MADDGALTRLIREHADGYTLRQLRDRAIDPKSGYQPAVETLAKMRRGQAVKPNPKLIRALAAGLGVDEKRVQVAAAEQYLGYVESPVGHDTQAVHTPGASTERAREVADRWESEGNPGAGS